MKVKELIQILQSFDPDSNIWINYDFYELQEPDFFIYQENVCRKDFYGSFKELKDLDIIHNAY